MMKYPITAMRLRSLLDEKGLTPQELADKSSVSKSSISLYLHGYNEPKSKNAKKMAVLVQIKQGIEYLYYVQENSEEF